MSVRPALAVEPERVLTDEAFSIRTAGFAAGDAVTIQARMVDGYGVAWESAASYTVDQRGALELVAGSASEHGAGDPMQLIWSMRPAARSQAMGYRAPPELADEVVHFTVSDQRGNSATAVTTRIHLSPGVERTGIAEAGVFGTLFVPDGQRHGAAIVVLSSSTGGVNERDAALYAAHGYTALALAYFNHQGVPRLLSRIPLEYFQNALSWLSRLDCVDEGRIAVTGRSRGGELALLLGGTFPEITCVLADVPSGVTWGGFGDHEAEGLSAWTYRGASLPFLPPRAFQALEQQSRTGDRQWDEERFLREARIGADRLRRCEIPVENTRGGILLISSEDDRVWPGTILSQIAEQRLTKSGFRYPFEHIRYPAAGHYVIPPYAPTTISRVAHPVTGEKYDVGGTPEGCHRAGVDSWRRKLAFLRASLQ